MSAGHTSFPPPADLLEGVRVLDLTNVLSGPYCTFQLAQLGAEVIKVENPKGGDLARQLGASVDLNARLMGVSFLAQNAGKKSITLNLKDKRGVDLFLKLMETADVVVENFRPGVMDRLGLGYETLSALNPKLIYCAISGFGQDGPLKTNPAYDQIIQGMSGVMSVTGDSDSSPLRVGYPVCDTLGGLAGAFAIVSALFSRSQSGKGRFIDVSMLEAQISALGWVVSNYLTTGIEPQAIGNENMTAAPSGTFQTADGPINIAANKQEQFETLCQLIGCPELAEDPRFAGRDDRKANRAALNIEINTSLASDTAANWEARLNEAGVPAGRVLSVPQILEHEQVAGRHLIQRLHDEKTQEDYFVTRSGFRCGDCEPAVTTPPPHLGEHTNTLLADLGIAAEELDSLKQAGTI